MARIVMEIKILDDEYDNKLSPPTMSFGLDLPAEQCDQIAREMHSHFEQVVNENPAARAAADVLAHATPKTVTIQQDFGTADPDNIFSNAATDAFWNRRRF